MKRFLILLVLAVSIMCIPVSAMEYEPPNVPEFGEYYMPDDTESFGKALWHIVKTALQELIPEITNTARCCLSVIAVMLLVSLVELIPGSNTAVINVAESVILGVILLKPSDVLVKLGSETINQLTEYGKLLIPVLTGALAAQGGVSSSAALYAGTVFFSSILSVMITKILLPILYVYFCISIVKAALGESSLAGLQGLVKWLITWGLKIVLYVFTGYISLTSVISGVTDASAVKAAKLSISGMVPVVGGILSEASETILLSAGIMKNAAGVYGILALLSILVGPFVKIGIQYLILKFTASVCSVFSTQSGANLLKDFSTGMGILLAATGTVCLLLLISIACFMKGVS